MNKKEYKNKLKKGYHVESEFRGEKQVITSFKIEPSPKTKRIKLTLYFSMKAVWFGYDEFSHNILFFNDRKDLLDWLNDESTTIYYKNQSTYISDNLKKDIKKELEFPFSDFETEQ